MEKNNSDLSIVNDIRKYDYVVCGKCKKKLVRLEGCSTMMIIEPFYCQGCSDTTCGCKCTQCHSDSCPTVDIRSDHDLSLDENGVCNNLDCDACYEEAEQK